MGRAAYGMDLTFGVSARTVFWFVVVVLLTSTDRHDYSFAWAERQSCHAMPCPRGLRI